MATWSIVGLTNALLAGRIDAEYFQPRYIEQAKALNRLECVRLGDIAFVTDGIHESPDVVDDNGIRYLSAKCVRPNELVVNDSLQISKRQHSANKRTQLRTLDVLLTTVGTIGNCAVVTPQILPANADRHLGIIRLKDDCGIDPYFVSTFFNSAFGLFQTLREATGNVQLNLFIEKIKMLQIPMLKAAADIARLTRTAYEDRQKGEAFLEEADRALLRVLGEIEDDPRPLVCYEGTISQAKQWDRLDAEYFQPLKWELLEHLSKEATGLIGDEYSSVRSVFDPRKGVEGEEVRNYDLTDALVHFLDEAVPLKEINSIKSVKRILAEGDIVISRLRSYLKEIAIVLNGHDTQMVGSTEFIVLRGKRSSIRAEALLIYLRSPHVQAILKWCQDGSNHPRFDEAELLRIPIPKVVRERQELLIGLVQNSIETRRRATRLLAEAIAATEREIIQCAN
jgi:hypothetical protein